MECKEVDKMSAEMIQWIMQSQGQQSGMLVSSILRWLRTVDGGVVQFVDGVSLITMSSRYGLDIMPSAWTS